MKRRRGHIAAVVAFVVLAAFAALITSGGNSSREDDFDAAARRARSNVRLAEAEHGRDSREAGAAHLRLAELLQARSNEYLADGAESARRALAITERLEGTENAEFARALERLAIWRWYAGEYEAELPLVERALAIRQRLVPLDEDSICGDYHFLSDIYRALGDNGRALQYRELVGPLVARINGPVSDGMAVHLHYLAVIQAAIGDRDSAIANAQRAVEIREKILPATDSRLARSLNFFGGLLVEAGETSRAEPVLTRALSIWEKSGRRDQSDVAAALSNLGRLDAARGDFASAARRSQRVAAIYSAGHGWDHPFLAARALARLGAAYVRLGDPEARSCLQRAVEQHERFGAASNLERAATLRELAMLDGAEGHLESAIDKVLKVESLSREHFRATSLGLSEREALTQVRGRIAGLDLAWPWASALGSRNELSDELTRRLIDESIRSRALVLDSLATRRRILALHGGELTASRVDALRRARARLAALTPAFAVEDRGASPDVVAAARVEADRADRDLAEVSREYRQENARGDLGLDDVRGAIPPGAMLVSYFRFASAGYFAAVIPASAGAVRIVPIGSSDEIDHLVSVWASAVSKDPRMEGVERSEAAYIDAARRLTARVWDPIAPNVAGAQLVFVVPDGSLSAVNFATLVTESGAYLAESPLSIHYFTAERDAVATLSARRGGSELLALGDPDFGAPRDDATRRFIPLPGSRDEVMDVAASWPKRERAKVLTGGAASEQALKKEAPSCRVLHVATHAFFEPGGVAAENPLRAAGLALAGANRGPSSAIGLESEDGVLTAEEVSLLDLSGVEWAILSACATGRGVIEPGEGVFGLRRAFQIAGARTVIVSLWPVEDDATRRWMRLLYAARRSGASTVDAVRASTHGLLDEQRRNGRTTHPYFWGGFVSVGDWH